jgi:hypothetical protein
LIVKGEVNMKKPALIIIIGLFALFAFTAVAQAQISAQIQIRDINNNLISDGQLVEMSTIIKVYGTYNDPAGTPATYKIDIYLDTGSGTYSLTANWTGTVQSGNTVTSPPYTLSKLGTYQFRFTATSGAMISCSETAQARTTIRLVTPEPATIAALSMGLAALGLFAFKKRRTK